jgi:hypothetical protein
MTWLADALRGGGLPVCEVDGWRTRGHGAMADVRGVVCHHTAGAAKGDGVWAATRVAGYPSLRVIVNGRTGLAGPLANLGLARDGTWVVVAAGQAWHAGTGSTPWCPAGTGNSRLIGVEAESVGTRDDWTREQREAYPRGVSMLLRYLKLPASRAIAHREWAPGRKIDPAFWDMAEFRREVGRFLAPPAVVVAAKTSPIPVLREDAMLIRSQPDKSKPDVVTGLLSGFNFVGLGRTETPSDEEARKQGIPVIWVEYGTWLEFDRRSHVLLGDDRKAASPNPLSP